MFQAPEMPRALFMAHMNVAQFTPEFMAYLPDNLHVYAAFEREAMRVVRKGFKHYSARTLIEVLRHHSALEDESGKAWKLNDHFTPGWARLFALMNPDHAKLFEFREAKAAKRERAHA